MSTTPMYSAKKSSTSSEFKKAEAFVNFEFPLPNGEVIKLRKGVPLEVANRFERSLINAKKANPDFSVTCVATVHLVQDDSDTEDYEF